MKVLISACTDTVCTVGYAAPNASESRSTCTRPSLGTRSSLQNEVNSPSRDPRTIARGRSHRRETRAERPLYRRRLKRDRKTEVRDEASRTMNADGETRRDRLELVRALDERR